MARVKRGEKIDAEQLWEAYRAIQLTPDQKAAARARLEKAGEEAARNGVYESGLQLIGQVHFDTSDLDDLRRDRD